MSDRRYQILKELGFPSYPARTYLALKDHGPSSARSLAQAAKVPVGKIYSALRYLIERGVVEDRAGRPQTYRAASLQRYLDPQRARFDLALSVIEGVRSDAQGTSPSHEFESLLARVQQPVIIARLGGAIESWNKASSRLFGYSSDEARHLPLEALVTPSARPHLALYLGLLDPTAPTPRAEVTLEVDALTRRGEQIHAHFELVALPPDGRDHPRIGMLVRPMETHKASLTDAQEHAGGIAVVRAGELVHFDHTFLRLIGHGSEAGSQPKPSRHDERPLELHRAITHVLRELRPGGRDASEQYRGTLVRRKGDPIPVELAIRPAALPGAAVVLLVRRLAAQ